MKVLLFANSDWYLYNFRLALAEAIRNAGHEVVLLSPPGKYSERLQQAGFRWIEFPLTRRGLNPLAELLTILRLLLIYRKERPAIVHHFTLKCVLYGSIAAHLTGIKGIVNALTGLGHLFSHDGLPARLLRSLVKFACRLAMKRTQVIFQNPDDHRAFLSGRIVSETNSHLIRGSGVNTERFKPTANSVANGNRRVLLAARLLWAKGIKEYVEAAREVRRFNPDIIFMLAGETDPGNPAAVPQATIDEWKAQRDVEVIGHCEDVRALLENVDLVALPTYYGEGVPRILIEAAASGKPLVATVMPGCSEIVQPGLNGRLVPARDSHELARAIHDILRDDNQRAAMGRHSRLLACEFSEDLVINNTFRVYQHSLPQAMSAGRSAWIGQPGEQAKESLSA